MINFSNASFVKSITNMIDAPKGQFREILLVGKSNVGKSSFINALTNKKNLAFTSSKPGHTRLLNYFNIDDKIYLVDAPGYGYAKGGIDLDRLFGEMMNDYFANANNLSLVIVLMDSRREISDDDTEIIDYLNDKNINFIITFTKCDKINQSEKAKLLNQINNLNINKEKILFSSIIKKVTFDKVRNVIEKNV